MIVLPDFPFCINIRFTRLITCVAISVLSAASMAEKLTPEQVLQKVIDHYPSINIAAIEIERARQSMQVANSQLGWQLDAQAGVERSVGLFGTTSDNMSATAGMSRVLESGSSVAVEGGVRREDNELVFSPTIPNPATVSNFGVSYRRPLAQNLTQTEFQHAITAAEQELESAMAERDEQYDQLALRVIDLYFSASATRARIYNINQSIDRTKRLRDFINSKTSLGIAEEKDILQVDAQLASQLAEKSTMETSWMQQMIALNRLMERPWDARFSTTDNVKAVTGEFDALYQQAQAYSPQIKLFDSRLALADSAIRSRRDGKENALDLVLFAGGQNSSGDSALGSTSESDLTGGVRLEYSRKMDKSGVDAKLYQAQLERDAILENRKMLLENLHYDLASVLAEIKANKLALDAYRKSLEVENKKIDEAMQRYHSGRIDTDVLINFEDQLSLARLSLELQRISLMQRQYKLKIILGQLWHEIKKPVFHDLLSDSQSGAGY